jgi:hypothetical protein
MLAAKRSGAPNSVLTAANALRIANVIHNNSNSAEEIVEQQSDISKAEIYHYIDRMLPYISTLPGTEPYFKAERNKLYAKLTSDATSGALRWFWTNAQPDRYFAELYDNAVTSYGDEVDITSSLEERQQCANKKTSKQRLNIARDHPSLSARLHDLHQEIIFKYVLNGYAKPLGEIVEYWRRLEFQARGPPHTHNLFWIKDKENGGVLLDSNSVTSKDSNVSDAVKALVATVSTAILLPLVEEKENDDDSNNDGEGKGMDFIDYCWDSNVPRNYFTDEDHPSRLRFESKGRDYTYQNSNLSDSVVRNLFRRWQLACQMHRCTFSCWKYCGFGPKVCRYNYPMLKENHSDQSSTIVSKLDNRRRKNTRVHPPRNNAHLNAHPSSALLCLACRGNSDLKYIDDGNGGPEYCCKYTSKADVADSKVTQNIIVRKLADYCLNYSMDQDRRQQYQQKLAIIMNAVVTGQQVGTVHACSLLLQQSFVKNNRATKTLNTICESNLSTLSVNLTKESLEGFDQEESVENRTPSSTVGVRTAYHNLCKLIDLKLSKEKSSIILRKLTFSAFVSAYSVMPYSTPLKPGSKIKIDEVVEFEFDERGFITNATTFVHNEVYYRMLKELPVLRIFPHFTIDRDNEVSCYSLLLQFSSWGLRGEKCMLWSDIQNKDVSAVEKFEEVVENFPSWIQASISRIKKSQEVLKDTGEVRNNETNQDESVEQNEIESTEADLSNQGEGIEVSNITSMPLSGNDNSRNPFVLYNQSPAQMDFLKTFVQRTKTKFLQCIEVENQQSVAEKDMSLLDPARIFHYTDHDERQNNLFLLEEKFNRLQKLAYETVKAHMFEKKQLFMFLSGEGGTGKSFVIKCVKLLAQIVYGRTVGSWGPICLMAPTGCAAYNIGGSTWHSKLGKKVKEGNTRHQLW